MQKQTVDKEVSKDRPNTPKGSSRAFWASKLRIVSDTAGFEPAFPLFKSDNLQAFDPQSEFIALIKCKNKLWIRRALK